MELEREPCDQSSMESAQDLVRKFRPLLQLMAARSGDHEKLLGDLEDAAEVAAVIAGWPREVVIDLAAASEGDTKLHRAAAGGDSECYRRCAELACEGDNSLLLACNGDGDTPLHCAARAGHLRMVSHLIGLAEGETAKAMVRMRNRRGETALHEAIRSSGDKQMKKMVKSLMAVDNQLAQVEAYDGTSPLFLAISLGHHNLARKLYKYDKELSYSGPERQNALHAAALYGFLHGKGIAKLLLQWKPNLIRQADHSGSTPLHFAASTRDPSLELFLFVFGDRGFESYSFPLSLSILPKNWVYWFCRWRNHPTIVLVEANPHAVFQPDRSGLYPAHVAALAGSLVPIVILLHHSPGCAGLRDAQGRTFLHVAVEKKMPNIVWFVARRLEYKAIMNIQDYEGNTALHLAVRGGNWDIFRNLIGNKHVCLNLTNKQGETPMDIAQSKVTPSGFYFGMHARRRILVTLTLANAKNSFCRRDHFLEEKVPNLNEEEESKKITDFAQIVGVGSVLVATATFAAAFTMPGGPRDDAQIPPEGEGGTPTLAGLYAFDAFVISNTLAFICSTLATFSLVYIGVAAVDIQKRIKLVAFSLALLISAARSFCAAFAFAIYVVLAPTVAHGTAMAACVMTVLAVMDAFWFMLAVVTDTTVLLSREAGVTSKTKRLMKLGARILVNNVYIFWPYIVIFGLLASKKITGHENTSAPAPTHR